MNLCIRAVFARSIVAALFIHGVVAVLFVVLLMEDLSGSDFDGAFCNSIPLVLSESHVITVWPWSFGLGKEHAQNAVAATDLMVAADCPQLVIALLVFVFKIFLGTFSLCCF